MTSLERVARFLGEQYYVGGEWLFRKGETMYAMNLPSEHGALLLALLERSATLGVGAAPNLLCGEGMWQFYLHKYEGIGPTPLAAMIQAVEKYQEGKE